MFRSFKKYFRELNYFLKVTRVAIWHEYLTRLTPLKKKKHSKQILSNILSTVYTSQSADCANTKG